MIGLFQEPGKKATVFVAQQKKQKTKQKTGIKVYSTH